jgi:hypothetical protein
LTVFFGACFIFAGLFLASFSNQLYQYYLTQGILYGIGASFTYFVSLSPFTCIMLYANNCFGKPAVSIPSQWFDKRRGLATGIAVSGSGVGGLLLSIATAQLLNSVGLGWTLRITAIFAFGLFSTSIPF